MSAMSVLGCVLLGALVVFLMISRGLFAGLPTMIRGAAGYHDAEGEEETFGLSESSE